MAAMCDVCSHLINIYQGEIHMLKCYTKTREALLRLSADQDGVVSFEYIIVACLIIGVVGAAFAKTGPLNTALVNGIAQIGTTLTAAL
jgi:hypothetical protein